MKIGIDKKTCILKTISEIIERSWFCGKHGCAIVPCVWRSVLSSLSIHIKRGRKNNHNEQEDEDEKKECVFVKHYVGIYDVVRKHF